MVVPSGAAIISVQPDAEDNLRSRVLTRDIPPFRYAKGWATQCQGFAECVDIRRFAA